MHGRVLESRFDDRTLGMSEYTPERAIQGHAHEGDDMRAVERDLVLECLPSVEILPRLEVIDARTRPRDEIGHAESPPGQLHVVLVRDWLWHESRVVQELPESIRRTGEVMPGLRRSDAGVDPDEQHAHAVLDAIGESQMGPGRFRMHASL